MACLLSEQRTHGAVCTPEAAAVMSGHAGGPEDNVVSSQGLDGNTLVSPPHPGEHTQGTWSAVSLHLRKETKLVL